MKNTITDPVSEMIGKTAGQEAPPSLEEMSEAMRKMAESRDEEIENTKRMRKQQNLPAYKLDAVRDGSDAYIGALRDAILAIAGGEYGGIDYKGYLIYYNDKPSVKSFSLKDGHREYSYWVRFECDALRIINCEEYHSEEERKAFLDPESDAFHTTIDLLDKEIQYLDDERWIKNRKTLNIYDFRDYSSEERRITSAAWEDRSREASETFSYLMEESISRTLGVLFTEADFELFAHVIRTMVFFADYGKRNYMFGLDGFVQFEWEPKTDADHYIKRCMEEFGQGDIPDRLLENCSLYYFLADPRGWEALAYLLPIMALWEMCQDYDPDSIKDGLLRTFDFVPGAGYADRVEAMIEEDRIRAGKGEEK